MSDELDEKNLLEARRAFKTVDTDLHGAKLVHDDAKKYLDELTTKRAAALKRLQDLIGK